MRDDRAEVLRDRRAPRGGAAAPAATTVASGSATGAGVLASIGPILLQPGEPAPDPVVEDHGDEQQGADRDLVPVGVDVGEDDALAGHAEREGAERRPGDGAVAAGQEASRR